MMTELELYDLIKENTSEYHSDGMFFIPPYNAEDFLKGLGIKDSEDEIECHVTCNGYLAFDMHDFESRFETTIEKVISILYKDIGT